MSVRSITTTLLAPKPKTYLNIELLSIEPKQFEVRSHLQKFEKIEQPCSKITLVTVFLIPPRNLDRSGSILETSLVSIDQFVEFKGSRNT